MRLTRAHATAFVEQLQCPVNLVLAEQGMLLAQPRFNELLAGRPIIQSRLPGGHHLHLDDEEGAQLVADCFNSFLRPS
jgi:hypothetical protein